MSIGYGLRRYYESFGLRGVLAISSHRRFGQPKEITGRAPGIRNPVHLRLPTTDRSIHAEILLRGGYAFDLPFPRKTIVDARADIGMASVNFANRYPEAKVITIEPGPSNFSMLFRNVRPYPAVVPVQAALWNRDGQISLGAPDPTTGASGKWAFVAHEGGHGDKGRAVTMHTLMGEMCVQTMDLAKIDIEGAEQEVFQDIRWLDGTGCLMIKLHDRFRSGCTEAVEPAMQGFSRSHRGKTTFYLRPTSSANRR